MSSGGARCFPICSFTWLCKVKVYRLALAASRMICSGRVACKNATRWARHSGQGSTCPKAHRNAAKAVAVCGSQAAAAACSRVQHAGPQTAFETCVISFYSRVPKRRRVLAVLPPSLRERLKGRSELLCSTPGVVYERLVYITFQTFCTILETRSANSQKQHDCVRKRSIDDLRYLLGYELEALPCARRASEKSKTTSTVL